MAEMAVLSLEIEKELKERAEGMFGSALFDVVEGLIRQSVEGGYVSDGEGNWYDPRYITREEFDSVKESMKHSEENPNDWISLDEFEMRTRRMLDEKLRIKNATQSRS